MSPEPSDAPVVVPSPNGDIIVSFGDRSVVVRCGQGPVKPGSTGPIYSGGDPQIPLKVAYEHDGVAAYMDRSPDEAPVYVDVPKHATVHLEKLDGLMRSAHEAGREVHFRTHVDG
jgi:hypothetical protein